MPGIFKATVPVCIILYWHHGDERMATSDVKGAIIVYGSELQEL